MQRVFFMLRFGRVIARIQILRDALVMTVDP